MLNKDKVEYFVFLTFAKFFKLIGLNGTRKFAQLLGLFIFYCIPIRKKVVFENLKTAFPEKSEKEIKRTALKTYRNIFITFFELMYLPNSDPEKIKSMMHLPDLEFMRSKIEEGKGVIFLTGHFGSWEIAGLSGALQLGIPFYVLAKPQRNQYVTDWWKSARESFGNKEIWLGVSVKHIFAALKSGGVIGMVSDQRGPQDSLRVNFFGKPTAFYNGTAAIAIKTKCNVVLGAIIRKDDFNYEAFVEELNMQNLPADPNEQIREVTQRYISFLERHIRNYPEQYFWLHKIWKY